MALKKIIPYSVLYPALLLLAVIGYFVSDYNSQQAEQKALENQKNFISDIAYVDLPRMNLTLSPSDAGKGGRVRLDLSLEVEKKNVGCLSRYQPRIADKLVNYIRQQDISSLRQADTRREFRSGLLEAVNKASYPVPIIDVVFKQLVFL